MTTSLATGSWSLTICWLFGLASCNMEMTNIHGTHGGMISTSADDNEWISDLSLSSYSTRRFGREAKIQNSSIFHNKQRITFEHNTKAFDKLLVVFHMCISDNVPWTKQWNITPLIHFQPKHLTVDTCISHASLMTFQHIKAKEHFTTGSPVL